MEQVSKLFWHWLVITQEVGLAWRTLTMEETDSYVVLQISFADMNQIYAKVQK